MHCGGILGGIPTTRSSDDDWPSDSEDAAPGTWGAIDIAKDAHVALIAHGSTRERYRVENLARDVDRFISHLSSRPQPVREAFEPTGVYHRPLGYRLVTAGFDVCFVSSLTGARSREARYSSWDKNDPKDARVIPEVLQHGMTMRFVEPSLLTHFLPRYSPAFAR